MESLEFVIQQAARQINFKVHSGNTLWAIEQLMNGYPELKLAVAFLIILRPEGFSVALHLHGQISGKALWHDAKIERSIRVLTQEGSALGIIERFDCAEARYAGSRKAKLSVLAVD